MVKFPRGGTAAFLLAAVLIIAGCSQPSRDLVADPSVASAAPSIELTPDDGASGVDPLAPVVATVRGGTLENVTLVNDGGRPVVGIMTPDRSSWKVGEPLGYGRTYTVTATARGGGQRASRTGSFTTLTPDNQAGVTLQTTGGTPLSTGGTYGVGIVIVAHFDEPIGDRAAAERRLSVRTTPGVEGSWYWLDDQNAHWRPREYYRPGTEVTVEARIYGADLDGGLYGQEDAEATFTIGDSHVAIADDRTKQVKVYENGNLVRTMPTSMGMGGTEVIGGTEISFWTQRGIYTVLDKANPVVMDSSTYGLPINSRLGYKQTIAYATRISTDGVYLHQLDETVWAQGNTNLSHGCLNLNGANARWFYQFSIPGDVVEVRNTGGAPLELWQNGDWGVPWEQWRAGSALA